MTKQERILKYDFIDVILLYTMKNNNFITKKIATAAKKINKVIL